MKVRALTLLAWPLMGDAVNPSWVVHGVQFERRTRPVEGLEAVENRSKHPPVLSLSRRRALETALMRALDARTSDAVRPVRRARSTRAARSINVFEQHGASRHSLRERAMHASSALSLPRGNRNVDCRPARTRHQGRRHADQHSRCGVSRLNFRHDRFRVPPASR